MRRSMPATNGGETSADRGHQALNGETPGPTREIPSGTRLALTLSEHYAGENMLSIARYRAIPFININLRSN